MSTTTKTPVVGNPFAEKARFNKAQRLANAVAAKFGVTAIPTNEALSSLAVEIGANEPSEITCEIVRALLADRAVTIEAVLSIVED